MSRRRRVVVVGAASGIGLATVDRLLEAEWDVLGIDVAPDVQDLAATRSGLTMVTADAVRFDELEAEIEAFAGFNGLPEVFICTAGRACGGDLGDLEPAEFEDALTSNVVPVFNILRYVLKRCDLARTTIIVVASGAGLLPRAGDPAYSATKAAVVSLTRAVGVARAREGLLAVVVCPGPVDTPLLRRELDRAPDPDAELHAILAACPSGLLMNASEAAQVLQWIAEERPVWLNGGAIPLDSGKSQALQT